MQEGLLFNTTGSYLYGGEWLTTHPVEIMTPIFLLFVILFALNFKTIKKSFSKVNRKTWIILLVIFLIGFWLRNAEYRYGYGYDGFLYLNSAKYMLEKDIQVWSCAIGNNERCYLYNQHLAPAGYPYLIFLVFLFFGVHDIFAMMISGILGSITIILVFLFTYLFFKKERIGLYASAVFALIPLDIFVSSTGAVRPTSIFFIALTMVIYYIALKKDDIKIWSLLAITFSYALYVRQENSVLLIPMFLIFLFEKRITKQSFKNIINTDFLKKYGIPVLIFLISQIPLQHWILFADRGLYPFRIENFPIMSYLITHTFFFNPTYYETFYNPLVSIIFFTSILLLFVKKQRKPALVIWVWFLAYFILYSIFFQCHGFPERLCFDYFRFMQHLNIPYAILAGAVLFSAEKILKVKKDIVFTVALLFLFLSPLLFPSLFKPSPTLFKDSRLEEFYVGDVITLINMTPKNSVLFTGQVIIPNFDYFQGDERNMVDLFLLTSNNYTYTKNLIKENTEKPMFLIEDWACSYTGDCKFLYDNFEYSVITTKNQINLVRLEPKKDFFT